ncbi:MAG: hypothetical protein WBV85_01120 [Solirubrobacteraceae bacterium]
MLFDDRVRDDPSPASAQEDSFTFLNRVDTPYWAQVRDLLEEWFSRYPVAEGVFLREDFRSRQAGQHVAAWWELYLHEMFTRLGYEIEIHPSILGTKRTPDFLIARGSAHLYVEATVVFSGIKSSDSQNDAPGWLLDAIDKIEQPNFFVVPLEVERGPERLKAREITRPLESWLSELDPDQAEADHTAGLGFPQMTFERRGWTIAYEAWPVRPEARGRENHKVLGGGPILSGWVDDIDQLQSKLKTKSGSYGRPSAPLVTAVLCASSFMEDEDIAQALFGREAVLIPTGPTIEGQLVRQQNGFWMWREGPQNKRVSAVLTAVQVHPWSASKVTPKLWLNPWADYPVTEAWPIPLVTTSQIGEIIYEDSETPIHSLLGLPSDWPHGRPFPRDH